MDGYRQTLLGRALADALRRIETSGGEGAGAGAIDGDAVFELFDEAVSAELAAGLRASGRRRKKQKRDAESGEGGASGEDAGAAPPSVFTHRSLALDARLRSFNRFEDKWSLQAAVPSGSLVLDHVPLRWGPDRHLHADDQDEQQDEQQGAAAHGNRGESGGEALPMLVKLQQLEGGKPSKK